ncbi:TraY domain-containing protein [Vibrio chagasii]|uniref:TraY domain-containing protein n=1 Tax=Vibrio chagasii TaxID=170679 RepID=UPI003734EA38
MSKISGESDSLSSDKKTHVTGVLDDHFNDLLNKSAKASGRSKKVEAEMRLKDHLARYESVTTVGVATERKTD